MIILKRLELQGFKSFAQKTVFEFPERIVGIVGPNGSGKSNVIDALRWVLGEREAKQLRGMTLGNLIFAGTPKKPPMGFATVSLYFDNQKELFSVPSKEVILTRRVDRSGTSIFFLNNEEIKLKDLLPILARARLGARGLTMIGQGQSTMFIESSPIERRMMIEEALGLKEFRLKKNDALRRLTSSETNILQVRAMLEELTPHLSFLRRQRKKWERRSELAHELRSIEDAYYSLKIINLKKIFSAIDHPSKEREKLLISKKEEIKLRESNIKKIQDSLSYFDEAKKIRISLQELFSKISEMKHAHAKIEAKIEYNKEISKKPIEENKIQELLYFIENELSALILISDVGVLKRNIEKILTRIRDIHSHKSFENISEGLVQEKKSIEKNIDKIQEQINIFHNREEELAINEKNANESFRKEIELLEILKNETQKIEEQIRNENFEREKINLRFEEIEREWTAFGRSLEELKKLPNNKEPISHLDENEYGRKMFRLRAQLGEVGDIDEAILVEAEEAEKREFFLLKELKDMEVAVSDLKKLIHDLDQKITKDFESSFKEINEEFQRYFSIMFGGGRARLFIQNFEEKTLNNEIEEENGSEERKPGGIQISVNIPKKKITNLEMLSGGEKSLVSLAALFALISVSPPPFLVLDEIDAALDETNARRFSDLVRGFSSNTQFVIVTHNRVTMEAAEALYGVTMADDGISKLLSLKFDQNVEIH